MHFETVFDVAQAGYRNWWLPALGLIFIAVGAFEVVFPRIARVVIQSGLSPRFFIIFSLVWTLVAFGMTFADYILARDALTSGQASIAEGVITDFHPMPYEGHAEENFVVAGKRFAYSDYAITSGHGCCRRGQSLDRS